MLHIQVSVGDGKSHRVALQPSATMDELRRAIWRMTGVPWVNAWYGGKCQVLMLRGIPLPTDDNASVTASGLADGDVVQLVNDKTALERGYTYLHCAAHDGVKEAVRALAEAADGAVDAKADYQQTALHLAAMWGHAEVAEDLVGVAADCDAVDSIGWTPLHPVKPCSSSSQG